jgi:Protein of unknown function, DUF481
MNIMHTIRRIELAVCCSVCLVLLICANAAAAAKTDVVYLRNGDRITCEIKNLERGRLKVSTDSMDTVYIEWVHIARIVSSEHFVVELQDGSRLNGFLADTDTEKGLLVRNDGGERLLDMQEVVWLDPLKLSSAHLQRWDGSASLGFDLAKANHATSLSASFDAHHRAETFIINLDASLYSSHQDTAPDSIRTNVGGAYRGLLKDRWFWVALGSGERNDEQGVNLRTLVGGGYGRYFIQTGKTLWSLYGGISANNEQRAGSESPTNSVEGFMSMDYEYFTYDTPKTSLSMKLTAYPSLTESRRIRASAEFAMRRELIKDFYVGLSYYYSYDSVPPDVGAKDDYGVVTSLGYTF